MLYVSFVSFSLFAPFHTVYLNVLVQAHLLVSAVLLKYVLYSWYWENRDFLFPRQFASTWIWWWGIQDHVQTEEFVGFIALGWTCNFLMPTVVQKSRWGPDDDSESRWGLVSLFSKSLVASRVFFFSLNVEFVYPEIWEIWSFEFQKERQLKLWVNIFFLTKSESV